MFKKKTGVKIMAVILAAAIAMPSAGIALAAGQNDARQETEDTGGTWWENLLQRLYDVDGSDGGNATSTLTKTRSSTDTSTRPVDCYEVKLTLKMPENTTITYGDAIENFEKGIQVTATYAKDGKDHEEGANVSDYSGEHYLLKYYKKIDGKYVELPEGTRPKDAGTYSVRAYSLETSKYKSKGSGYGDFIIAKKTITVKPKDRTIHIEETKEFPEAWDVVLTTDSALAYEEKFVSGTAACVVRKGADEVKVPEVGVYSLEITGIPQLNLQTADGAEASLDNYTVEIAGTGTLTISKKLALQVERKDFEYGDLKDGDLEKKDIFTVIAFGEEGTAIDKTRLSFEYYKADAEELTEENKLESSQIRNVGAYKVVAKYAFDESDYFSGQGEATFQITERTITVTPESFPIENGDPLPEESSLKVDVEGYVDKGNGEEGLPYEDKWTNEPVAEFVDKDIDTTVAGNYTIQAKAVLDDVCAKNYKLDLKTGTMTVGVAPGEEKETLKLALDDVTVTYGDGASKDDPSKNVEEAVIAQIKATKADGTEQGLQPAGIVLKYFDADGKQLEKAPVDVDKRGFSVEASYKGDEAFQPCEGDAAVKAKLMIVEREITLQAKSYGIANGAVGDVVVPDPELEETADLSYGDKWAESDAPKAVYKDGKENIDTKKPEGAVYDIIVSAEVEEAKKGNYNIVSKEGKLTVAKLTAGNKSEYIFDLKEDAPRTKIYDGQAFDSINAGNVKDFVVSDFDYDKGKGFTLVWSSNGAVLDGAPIDVGTYTLTVKVPEDNTVWEGSKDVEITIAPKPVTVGIKTQSGETQTYIGETLGCEIDDSMTEFCTRTDTGEKDGWAKKPVVKVLDPAAVNKEGSYQVTAEGGDAGENYNVTYTPLSITVAGKRRLLIEEGNVVVKDLGKKGTYTGEQICPTVTVTAKDHDKPNKSVKLKLNVDYVVDYSNNVNAGENTASVSVQGIGEYAGYITKTFSIKKKDIKSVSLSEVGIVRADGNWKNDLKNALVVMDGNYEVTSDEYEIEIAKENKGKSTSYESLSELIIGDDDFFDKALLRVKAASNGNYGGDVSKKTVKLLIFGKNMAGNLKPITDVVKGEEDIIFKQPNKQYTYNGKAQKPAVKLQQGGVKFKTVYSNNVNAGTGTVRIVGVYSKKKGQYEGYYGVSVPKSFEIKTKGIDKVKVSGGTAIPKGISVADIKLTVKDGKRILTEGVDYSKEVQASFVENGRIKSDVKTGEKCTVTISALPGGNYTVPSSNDKFKAKFGQINLASKTADVTVTTTGTADSVTVTFNGVVLDKTKDYEVTKCKIQKDGKYTITIKANKTAGKNCLYKGSRTMKNVVAIQQPVQQ